MQLIKVNPIEFGIEESKAQQMVSGLLPIVEEREVLAAQYADVIRLELVPETLKAARELRLKIRDNRTKGVEKWHKANKEFYLAGGRFVDAIKNKEIAENIRMEDNLEQIEKHFENIKKQRIADLQKERESLLIPLQVENVGSLNLGNMPTDIWDGFYLGQKIKFEERKEAERLAAEAEVKRIEEEKAERERIKLENERLKAEAEAKEKELQAERERVKKERQAIEDAAELERQKAAAELAKQQESARKEREASEKERARIAAELQAKKDAEAKAERERLAEEDRQRKAAEKAAKAPVKQKLTAWVDGFVMGTPPGMNEDENVKNILNKFEAFKAWAKTQIEQL
jgi:colicin import membrane protein